MKNLKKVLALVLAFACAFTMFAGAAFTDQADIQSTEAVDALTGLGVIEGYTDGSFKPDATVTRAEMAKMIFTILNGGNDDASAYTNLPTSFTDVNGTWAAGYIKYLQNSEIIAGKSATKFAPNDTVTGLEAAKMLLVVAGYTPSKAGLTGSAWAANTMKYGNLNNLFEDVSSDVNGALPRQYAAQIMFNSLEMERVVYSNDIGDFKPAEDVTDAVTIGEKYLDLDFYGDDEEVVLYGTEKEANRDTYNLDTSARDFTRVANDYSDLVGQRVVVMHKNGKTNEVYGVYAYEDSNVVATGYVGQLETVSDNTKIKLDGTEYKLDDSTAMKVYTFGNDAEAKVALSDLAGYAKNDGTAVQNNVARSIKLVDNDGDGNVDSIISNPVSFGQVTYVGTSSMTVNNGVGSLKFDDISGYEDIAKDDYVFVLDDKYNSSDKDIVTKADITSATVEATRGSEARVDGTWYRWAKGVSVTTGSSYDMVLCGNYILAADETKGSLEEVALLSAVKMDANGTNVDIDMGVGSLNDEGTVEARMYFADGTNTTVKISKYAGNKLLGDSDNIDITKPNDGKVGANVLKGMSGLVTFSKLADGTYDVEAVGTGNLAGCDDKKGATGIKDGKIDRMLINDDAVIYVEANDEIKVLTGAAVAKWDDITFKAGANSAVLTETKSGLPYVAAGYLVVDQKKVPGATSDTKYGYLTADPYLVKTDDGNKATYEVWTNEGAKTLTADSSSTSKVAAGDLIAYTINGNYIDLEAVTAVKVAIIGTNNEAKGVAQLTTGDKTSDTYSFDDDCVFVAIDASEKDGAEGGIGSIPTAEEVLDKDGKATGSYYANAYVIFNDDGDKIVAVFYDVDNKLDSTQLAAK